MNPLQHLVITAAIDPRPSALLWALAPDVVNIPLLFATRRLSERSRRVLLSRVAHSPIVVCVLLIVTHGAAWPYALHWACDVATHERRQWSWPM